MISRAKNGGFLRWWYPRTMGFPTKNDRFGVFWGYHHLRKHPYMGPINSGENDIYSRWQSISRPQPPRSPQLNGAV